MKELYCEHCGRQITDIHNPHTMKVDGVRMYLCNKHFHQQQNYGKFLDKNPRTIQDKNDYEIFDNIATVYTYDNNAVRNGSFIIDIADLDKVLRRKWCLSHGRIVSKHNGKLSHIGAYILNITDKNTLVDHINRDPLDNRRSNLRTATYQQNSMNRTPSESNTGITGVCWDRANRKFIAHIKYNRKQINLGRFDYPSAVYARYVAEQILFKDFRPTANDALIQRIIKFCNNKEDIERHVRKAIDRRVSLSKQESA